MNTHSFNASVGAARAVQPVGNLHPHECDGFFRDLQEGLSQREKSISPKYFYDQRGSALFDRICELPEYYPTRTEMAILRHHAGDIGQRMGRHAEIVEFGAGSLHKVRLLLSAMDEPSRFVPVDISGTHLHGAVQRMRADYPQLCVQPVTADYTQQWELPAALAQGGRRIAFFPGSSIGNFAPAQAAAFLRSCARSLPGGALLLGADLIKHPDTLHAAYNDAQGVTAAFNRNVLERANRELGANFKLHQFHHSAFYNAPRQRIEMHLVSTRQQVVHVGATVLRFEEGETVHTENSHKFTIEGLQRLAADAGLQAGPVWTDPQQWFGVLWFDIPAVPRMAPSPAEIRGRP